MSASDLRLLAAIIACLFLFYGEPDVFDKLRAYAMTALDNASTKGKTP